MKRLIILICVIVTGICFAGQVKPSRGIQLNAGNPLTRDVVGCWMMNEGTGPISHDVSGYNNDGTLTGTSPTWTGGAFGPAVHLDTDEYITCSNPVLLQFDGGNVDFTIVASITPHSVSGQDRTIVSRWGNLGAEQSWILKIERDDASIKWVYSKNDVSYSTARSSAGSIVVNQTYLIVGTKRSNLMSLYIDGVLVDTDNSQDGTIRDTATNLRFGWGDQSDYYHGVINYIIIFDRALSASEIRHLSQFLMFDTQAGSWVGTVTGPAVAPRSQAIIIAAIGKLSILCLMFLFVRYRIKANFIIILCVLTVPVVAVITPVEDGGTGKPDWLEYCIPWASGPWTFGEIAIGTPGQYLCVNRDWGNRGYFWDTLTTDNVPEGTEADRKYCTLAQIRDLLNSDFHNIGGNDDDTPDNDDEVPDTITVNSREKIIATCEGEQLRLAYDVDSYASFTVDSGGDLTINPMGDLILEGAYLTITDDYILADDTLRLKANDDIDDYIIINSVGDVPQISTEGNSDLYLRASGGNISFGNENLTTTGTLASGNATVTGDVDVSGEADFAGDLIMSPSTADYLWTSRGTQALALHNQTDGYVEWDFFTAAADGGDNLIFVLYASADAPPADINPNQQLRFQFKTADQTMNLWSHALNDTILPIHIYCTGATNQIVCEADGDVVMATLPEFASGTALYIDASDRLGTLSSAAKYKKNIVDVPATDSEKIYQLRPTKYDAADGSAANLFGFVAEEVNDVMPELIRYKVEKIMDERDMGDGEMEPYIKEWRLTDEPAGVHMDRLMPLLLKELQTLKARVDSLEAEIEELKRAE